LNVAFKDGYSLFIINQLTNSNLIFCFNLIIMKKLLINLYSCFFLLILFTGCAKKKEPTQGCALSIAPLNLKFNVVDSDGNDLFFSTTAINPTTSLWVFEASDKARKDTLRPAVEGTGTARFFQLNINNTIAKDTLILSIPNNTDKPILYTIKQESNPCPTYVINQVYFNETIVSSDQGKYIFSE
jgi:hypothetical protein